MSEEANLPPCEFCGSKNVWKAGFTIRSSPYRKLQRYQCKDCGKHYQLDPAKEQKPIE